MSNTEKTESQRGPGRPRNQKRDWSVSYLDKQRKNNKAPWGPLYVADSSDIYVAPISDIAVRIWLGLWRFMGHKNVFAGYLVDDDGAPYSIEFLAGRLGKQPRVVRRCLDELIRAKIFKETEGIVFSPSLLDEAERQKEKKRNHKDFVNFSVKIIKKHNFPRVVVVTEGSDSETLTENQGSELYPPLDREVDRDVDRDLPNLSAKPITAPSPTPSASPGVGSSLVSDGKADIRHGSGSVPTEPEPAPSPPTREQLQAHRDEWKEWFGWCPPITLDEMERHMREHGAHPDVVPGAIKVAVGLQGVNRTMVKHGESQYCGKHWLRNQQKAA